MWHLEKCSYKINTTAFTADVEIFQTTIKIKTMFYDSGHSCISLKLRNDSVTVTLHNVATRKA